MTMTNGKKYIIRKWDSIKLENANLDDRTLKYIEYVAQEKGQAAIDKYMKWTGWYDVGKGSNTERRQTPAIDRIFNATLEASTIRWGK